MTWMDSGTEQKGVKWKEYKNCQKRQWSHMQGGLLRHPAGQPNGNEALCNIGIMFIDKMDNTVY